MIALRAFSLLAAILLVGAFALALLGPQDMTLGDALHGFDTGLVPRLQAACGPLLWRAVTPLLARPAWLPIAALGLVATGVAASLGTSRPSQTRRRRS